MLTNLTGNSLTQIVASGCSFTDGWGLNDSKSQAWPGKLGKKLDIESFNYARQGMGNMYIIETIMKYFFENPNKKSTSLVCIAWTDFARQDFPCGNTKDAQISTIPNHAESDEFINMFYEKHYNHYYWYRRWVFLIHMMQSWLKANNIDYIMFDALPGGHLVRSKMPELWDMYRQIDKSDYIKCGDFCFKTMLPDELFPAHAPFFSHPTETAHDMMADIIIEHLNNTGRIK
jgi:hypothetical protein